MTEFEPSESSRYAESGVDTNSAENSLSGLIEHILPTRDYNPRHLVKIKSAYFSNVIDLGNGEGIAFCTDGVGTKIIVAELMGKYDTIGIDCVAMNVNDLICVGARPVSMVDYIGCSHTNAKVFAELGKGLAEGARQAGISICGGEVSQVREIINGIDLIGAAIGQVRLDRINTGRNIKPGNLIIGLASSGVHSNGLTLARHALLSDKLENQKAGVNEYAPEIDQTLGMELLTPTRIYVREVMEMLDSGIDLKAMVHITGGGFCNLNRVESENIRFVLDDLHPAPPVFSLIQARGEVSDAEMYQVFNMGVGFCVIVEGTHEVEAVSKICEKYDLPCHVIGYVEACHGKEVTIPVKGLVGRGHKFRPAGAT